MRIFVSYSRKSNIHIQDLIKDLKGLDYEVWYDQHLIGGHIWWEEILDNIRKCDIFIFAQSSYSVDSEPCLLELEYAVALQRPVIPVILEGEFSQFQMPSIIANRQYVDYRQKDKEATLILNRSIKRQSIPDSLPTPLPEPPLQPKEKETYQPRYSYATQQAQPETIVGPRMPSSYVPLLLLFLLSLYLGFLGWSSIRISIC